MPNEAFNTDREYAASGVPGGAPALGKPPNLPASKRVFGREHRKAGGYLETSIVPTTRPDHDGNHIPRRQIEAAKPTSIKNTTTATTPRIFLQLSCVISVLYFSILQIAAG
jgi:hypothetical protein